VGRRFEPVWAHDYFRIVQHQLLNLILNLNLSDISQM